MTGTGPLTIEDVIHALRTADGTLPRVAMQWALDNWAEAAPRFLRMIDDYLSGADDS